MPESEEPYGAGYRLAWCPHCCEIYGQASVVAVPPGTNVVRCDRHGHSILAPPLGAKDDSGACVYPVGRTTCGFTRAAHGHAATHPFIAHDFTLSMEK